MGIEEFLRKYKILGGNEENVAPEDMAGWITVMDFLYCTRTKEEVIEMVADFYDHADDIFNSINEAVGDMILEDIAAEKMN